MTTDPKFANTSAFYAFIDETDLQHARAMAVWRTLIAERVPLLTTNYVIAECAALLQRRIGLVAVRRLQQMLSEVQVFWIRPAEHEAGMSVLLASDRRKLSLVDCVSFVVMCQERIDTAFAFDEHFAEQGFDVLS